MDDWLRGYDSSGDPVLFAREWAVESSHTRALAELANVKLGQLERELEIKTKLIRLLHLLVQ